MCTVKTGFSLIVAAMLLIAMAGCSRSWSNFSQAPGFSEYYAQNPRNSQAATPEEQTLLNRFRPRLFLDATSEGPISFYRDYIAQGVLKDSAGKVLSEQVDSRQLNQVRDNPNIEFVHQPQPGPVTPEVFARIDYDEHPRLGKLAFLTYHFVFRSSGMAAGLPGWQELLLPLIGDPDDWHQLDHYTSAIVVLDESATAIALILQQHNHERSYVLGVDLPRPENGNIRLVAAKRSNELYPWHNGVEEHRIVRFMSDETLPYLVTGQSKPWLAGNDVTEAAREVDYQLSYIPASDAFYRFTGYLGQRRSMAGRDGPPGADYNTLPIFKRPVVRLVAFNWQEDDIRQMNALLDFFTDARTDQPSFNNLLDNFKAKLVVGQGEDKKGEVAEK
ncbi:MAG: hypothetical protein V7731_17775 [Amphritea sp.]